MQHLRETNLSIVPQAKETLNYGCEVSKGTLKFPIGKKLPKTLVRKLISVRHRQIIEKQKGSSSVKPKK